MLQFVIEQPRLSFESSAVTGEGTVGPDHPVTGHDDGDGVTSVGQADGARRLGIPDAPRQFTVRNRLAVRYLSQPRPHALLERRADQIHLEVQRPQLSREVGIELSGDVFEPGVVAYGVD